MAILLTGLQFEIRTLSRALMVNYLLEVGLEPIMHLVLINYKFLYDMDISQILYPLKGRRRYLSGGYSKKSYPKLSNTWKVARDRLN